ncbi:MAG: hypothetical protein R2741_04175 [Methanolobus sp.]
MSFSEMLDAFRQLREPVIRLLKGLIRAIKVPYAKIDAVYDLRPVIYGIACGYSYAVMSYLHCHVKNLKMYLEPDFVESRLDLDVAGKIRIRPYRFIPVFLLFILNRNVLRFSWNFIIKRSPKKTSVKHFNSMCH